MLTSNLVVIEVRKCFDPWLHCKVLWLVWLEEGNQHHNPPPQAPVVYKSQGLEGLRFFGFWWFLGGLGTLNTISLLMFELWVMLYQSKFDFRSINTITCLFFRFDQGKKEAFFLVDWRGKTLYILTVFCGLCFIMCALPSKPLNKQ